MFSIFSSTGCPIFFFCFVYNLGCFEWKKYCQMHSADVLYFKRKPLFYGLKTFTPSEYSWPLAVVCCCTFSSMINDILFIYTLRGRSHVIAQGTWSNHLWSSFASNDCLCTINLWVSFQSEHMIHVNDAWHVLKNQTGNRSSDTNCAIKPWQI